MDCYDFLMPLVTEIEKLLKSASKERFKRHIEGFFVAWEKTKRKGKQQETYSDAYVWISYPPRGQRDVFTGARHPTKTERLDLAYFRLAVLYSGYHQRPGADIICFDLCNLPSDERSMVAEMYWSETKNMIEHNRQSEVESLFNQDLRIVEADLASTKPAGTKQKDTPTTIININKLGVLGDIQQVETLQTGDNASTYKHIGNEEKKKGILNKIPYWIYLLVSFLAALFACIHYWPEIHQKLQSLFSH
jgi:hypothetical protein